LALRACRGASAIDDRASVARMQMGFGKASTRQQIHIFNLLLESGGRENSQ